MPSKLRLLTNLFERTLLNFDFHNCPYFKDCPFEPFKIVILSNFQGRNSNFQENDLTCYLILKGTNYNWHTAKLVENREPFVN